MMEKIFKRKLYDRLLEWKRVQNGKTAILVEGCRQEVKTFDIMLSRNAARFPINKKDMIPANLHKAIEVLRKLTTGEATLDQTEIALDLIGYTYDSLAASVGKLAIDIG